MAVVIRPVINALNLAFEFDYLYDFSFSLVEFVDHDEVFLLALIHNSASQYDFLKLRTVLVICLFLFLFSEVLNLDKPCRPFKDGHLNEVQGQQFQAVLFEAGIHIVSRSLEPIHLNDI